MTSILLHVSPTKPLIIVDSLIFATQLTVPTHLLCQSTVTFFKAVSFLLCCCYCLIWVTQAAHLQGFTLVLITLFKACFLLYFSAVCTSIAVCKCGSVIQAALFWNWSTFLSFISVFHYKNNGVFFLYILFLLFESLLREILITTAIWLFIETLHSRWNEKDAIIFINLWSMLFCVWQFP